MNSPRDLLIIMNVVGGCYHVHVYNLPGTHIYTVRTSLSCYAKAEKGALKLTAYILQSSSIPM